MNDFIYEYIEDHGFSSIKLLQNAHLDAIQDTTSFEKVNYHTEMLKHIEKVADMLFPRINDIKINKNNV